MPQDHSSLPATIPASNVEIYRMSTDAAGLCGEIVKATAQKIQGKRYVKVEGWQAIAIAHGCTGSARGVEAVDGGIRAIGEVRRMSDGLVIATGEGFVGDDEKMWAGRPTYARRAMAQTRAISRACRSAFAHVVVMIDANLCTTPAEEMDWGEPVERPTMANAATNSIEDARHDIEQATGSGKSAYRLEKEKECTAWVTTSIQTFNLAGQHPDSLKSYWRDHIKRIEWMEANMPDDYERLLVAFDAAMDKALAQVPA